MGRIWESLTLVGEGKVARHAKTKYGAVSSTGRGSRNNKFRRSQLPPVLCGPIVRRVDRESAWIWLATSLPVEVEGSVLEGGVSIGRGTAKSLRIGHRLHITLIQIAARTSYPILKVLEYSLVLRGIARKNEQVYFDGSVAIDAADICLKDQSLPCFVVPDPDESKTAFLYGSCRKLHGRGKDAIPRALKLLEATARTGMDRRPLHLLLGGDQIYGDDVHADVLENIRELALRLMGTENLPGVKWSTYQLDEASDKDDSERWPILKKGGFTAGAGAGKNHLMGIGDYAALYLLSWSPVAWSISKKPKLGATAGQMRKLMANLPTYMIFDDHDVTDDWNLGMKWANTVRGHDTTRRVVANALAAFWAFQAIGNEKPSRTIQSIVEKNPVETGTDKKPFGDGFDNALWDHHGWSFVAPTGPPTVVMNTRTQRRLGANLQTAPGLLNDAGFRDFARQLDAFKSQADSRAACMIVSPVPVVGFPLENLQEVFGRVDGDWVPGLRRGLNLDKDPESWAFHPKTFDRFLRKLLDTGIKHFVLLSGDVHYGFVCAGRFERRNGGTKEGFDFVQLTSSALKNAPSGKEGKFIRSLLPWRPIYEDGVHPAGGVRGWWEWDEGRRIPADSNEAIARALVKKHGTPDQSLRWRYLQHNGSPVVTDNNAGFVELLHWRVTQRLMKAGGGNQTIAVNFADIEKLCAPDYRPF